MNLLPKSSKVFTSKEYWNEFFSKRGTKSFEWYGEYAELCNHLHKYMKPSDNILVAGCGNSAISADLYKCGLKQITNVDISEIVIQQMKEKYASKCDQMKWIQGDLFNLQFESEYFSSVLDKGTLDALMSNSSDSASTDVNQYFQEVGRVLRFGGRYICISLLQEHILSALLCWFPSNGWIIRFCRSEEAENSQLDKGSFSFPVFVVVCTKFKVLGNFKPIIELNLYKEQLDRVQAKDVTQAVTSLHEFSLLRHNLRKKVLTGEEIKLDLCNPKSGAVRYRLYICDSPKITNDLPFAVFIVPHGRETEWLFRSTKGQKQLCESSKANRLVVVHLMRDEHYGTMNDVQDELAPKIIELAPKRIPKNYKIPFLSVGSDLGERKEVFRSRSMFSGEFVVEEVKDEGMSSSRRRLIFLQNQNVVQSEAKLIPDKRRKKGELRKVIDTAYLACTHHTIMLAAFELISCGDSYSASVLLVGLGGGLLASFIHKYFPKVTLTAVDIDEEIVKVAKNWFNFRLDSRLKCEIEDGVQFIKSATSKGLKYDVIMFDIDSKEVSEGLSCPPKQFVERSFLDTVASCLTERGLFVLNLVCRDETIRENIMVDLKATFPTIVFVTVPEEVNVVLFCQITSREKISKDEMIKKINNLNSHLKASANVREVLNQREIADNFKVL